MSSAAASDGGLRFANDHPERRAFAPARNAFVGLNLDQYIPGVVNRSERDGDGRFERNVVAVKGNLGDFHGNVPDSILLSAVQSSRRQQDAVGYIITLETGSYPDLE